MDDPLKFARELKTRTFTLEDLTKNEENIDKTTPYYVEWMNNLNSKLKNSRDHSLILLAIGLLCCLYGFFINYFAIRNDCSIFFRCCLNISF